MIKCVVPACPNVATDPNYQFFDFPKTNLQGIWHEKCSVSPEFDINLLKICEAHFLPTDFERDARNPSNKKLTFKAVPSQNLDGPPINIQTLDSFRPDIIKEIDKHRKLKERFEELQKEMKKINSKFSFLDERLVSKARESKKIRVKYNRLKKKSVVKCKNVILSKVFSNAQINYLMGKKKVVWSDDDMAMAFSLRQLSSKECYLYLKHELNIPLPALSCVQKWAASK